MHMLYDIVLKLSKLRIFCFFNKYAKLQAPAKNESESGTITGQFELTDNNEVMWIKIVSMVDQNGNDFKGGASVTYMPAYVNDLNRIVNIYLNKIAEDICSSLPVIQLEKHVLEKEKEDAKKAAAQRSEIEKY